MEELVDVELVLDVVGTVDVNVVVVDVVVVITPPATASSTAFCPLHNIVTLTEYLLPAIRPSIDIGGTSIPS